jgi:alpha-amylase
MRKFKNAALATLAMCFYACNSTDELQGPTAEIKALSKVIDVTHHDGHPFSTGKSMTHDYRKI